MTKSTVFISYSHADGQFVDRLADKLKAVGVGVWIDKWEIQVGDSITGKVNEAIEASDFLVAVLSRASVKSKWVKEELNTALIRNIEGKNAFILPVLIEECKIPEMLRHRRYADFAADPEQAFRDLLEVLQPFKLLEPEMILIPAGEFLMGSDPSVDQDAASREQPQHTLYLPEYYLGKTQVTNAQYATFVKATDYYQPENWIGGNPPRDKEDHPVLVVSWHDAVTYCRWLAEITGKPYRLPNEAEWEKGARGTDGRIYPWGNRWDAERCNTRESSKPGDTTPVGAYPEGASPYGVLDMAGNIWEWTNSLWKPYPYRSDDGREDPSTWGRRVIRGGSWNYYRRGARCASRYRYSPGPRYYHRGFRVAASPSPP
jgi:formylglycine-generating enzyme required for sulfatase activity